MFSIITSALGFGAAVCATGFCAATAIDQGKNLKANIDSYKAAKNAPTEEDLEEVDEAVDQVAEDLEG